MTHEEILRLPMRTYSGPIVMVATPSDLKRAMKSIRKSKVVGLDTETKPTFKKGQRYLPCLVQVAAASAVFLFQLKRMSFSDALSEMLQDSSLVKAGIGLANDFTKLQEVFPFDAKNIVDLSLIAQKQGMKRSSVRYLSAEFLGFRISKGPATSNWANPRLTKRQITYAATDAWICRELYMRFQKLGFLTGEMET